MTEKFILYIDDSGSRDPDKQMLKGVIRRDSMDYFALGGILIKDEDKNEILTKHKEFCDTWKIDYPLHSSSIRGGHGKFAWLKKPENAAEFLPSLQEFIVGLPIIATACVINRPNHVLKYKENFPDNLWLMCKTAFSILIERTAKFSALNKRPLEIFFEESGKHEDRDIIRYLKELKQKGNPFNLDNSKKYTPLKAEDYKKIILGDPRRKTKKLPMLQIADLVLYPIAKSGYDPTYKPYVSLKKNGILIDTKLNPEQIKAMGIKYSCFGELKKE